MKRKAIFIAATGQHVGKTTLCLGLIAALRKKFPRLGFMKPVGQQHKTVDGHRVDKDVILFKEYFNIQMPYPPMSPVIFPRGFTRDYLDGKIHEEILYKKILRSFYEIEEKSDFVVVEGTGHVGVGSLVNLSNAKVASLLGLEIVIIGLGGIGSTFDELALNKAMCDQYNVKIHGVILNRVEEDKRSMVINYMEKALHRWKVPLIGCIPYDPFLDMPSMEDFEILFDTKLIAGEKYHYCHYGKIRLVAISLEQFKDAIISNQVIVTPATREDIIHLLIDKKKEMESLEPEFGLILTGHPPPSSFLIDKLKKAQIPTLYADRSSYEAMRMLASYTAKIGRDDTSKVEKAIQLIEKYINISLL